MKIPHALTLAELQTLMEVIDEGLAVRSHLELFNWLRQGVGPFLPHHIVIAAWGDFSLGLVRHDLVSGLPGFRTDEVDQGDLNLLVNDLFARWKLNAHAPLTVLCDQGASLYEGDRPELAKVFNAMPTALVHGIKDQRGRHDCLYVFLGADDLGRERCGHLLRYLLPYIDTAFRQVAHLPEQYLPAAALQAGDSAGSEADDSPTDEFGLSAREHDIMEWVCAGKTNQEIGLILDISVFTVKNHIQRIFKKLNVVNRAQAVSKLGRGRNNGRG